MQTETHIIAFSLLVGWLTTTLFLTNAIRKASSRAKLYEQQLIELDQKLTRQQALCKSDAERLSAKGDA